MNCISKLEEDMMAGDLSTQDPELYDLLSQEKERQKKSINLIASENYISKEVLQALSSSLSNDYADGYPGSRHGHCTEVVDKIESLCRKRALEAFDLDPEIWSVNVQPHSASGANFAAFLGAVAPGGRIMGLDVPDGGHRTHGMYTKDKAVAATSMVFTTLPYKLDPDTGLINYDELRKLALLFKPKLIIAGTSAYSRLLDYGRFREICDETKALLLADMAHIGGMVVAKVMPSPFVYADIVTTTGHKSLRGPRAGFIFYRKAVGDIGTRIDAAVYPGLQSSPHLNVIAAAAVALKEAKSSEFREYQIQVLKNAKILGETLKELGYSVITGGTETHQCLVDVSSFSFNRDRLGYILDEICVVINRRPGPNNITPRIRLGTPAMTSRGVKEADIVKIANFLHRGIQLARRYQFRGGKSLDSFKQFCQSDPEVSSEINNLKNEVQRFASSLFMPGFQEF